MRQQSSHDGPVAGSAGAEGRRHFGVGVRPPEVQVPVAGEPAAALETEPERSPIWAVGGGKGGTGKTFVSAALAQQLARHGLAVNLVDADFGAPNLHTFLGVQDPSTDLSHFFYGNRLPLEEVLVEADGNGLKLAAGSNRRFSLANLEYFRRLRLLRHIRALPGQVIVDTGAGTALNSIDFFNVSDLPILVTNANPASIENLFLFLEAVALRILKQEVRTLGLQKEVSRRWEAEGKPPESVPSLLGIARDLGGGYQRRLLEALEPFQPCLIVNKTRGDEDILLGRCLVDVAKRCLGTRLCYVGAVPFDRRVTECLTRFLPFVSTHPSSEAAVAIMLIMDRLLERSQSLERQQ